MKHLMVDLETLGQTPGCVLFSIGAVPFCPTEQKVGEGIQILVSPTDAEATGLFTEQSTVDWWKTQSEEARADLVEASKKGLLLANALGKLTDFLVHDTSLAPVSEIRVWGNGSDFDNAILSAAYRAAGLPVPWKFWNNRCFRTLKSMAPKATQPRREGTHHRALDDAIHQARWANEIVGHLGMTQWPGL